MNTPLRNKLILILPLLLMPFPEHAQATSDICYNYSNGRMAPAGRQMDIELSDICFQVVRHSNAKGSMIPPDERIVVDSGKKSNLHVVADTKRIDCTPMFQDSATVSAGFGDSGQIHAILSYKHCPIPLPEKLDVVRLTHREPIEIRIERVIGGLLYPASNSNAGLLVGIAYCDSCGFSNMENVTLAPNYAENVTWIFENADMQFDIGSKHYRTLKPAAKISFVEGHVQMEGIEVVPLEPKVKPDKAASSLSKATEFPETGTKWHETKLDIPGTIISASNRSPLHIVTKGKHVGYYVKLVDWVTGNSERAYFIRGGETLKVQIPVGSYETRYAVGTEWFGEVDLFGPDTQYFTTQKALHFTPTGGYAIELIPQVGGNLPTRQMQRDDW